MIRRLHVPAIRCLTLFGVWLMAASMLTAQDELIGEFSSRPEIEKRLTTAHQESSQAAGDQKDALQELESVCQYHLAALDLVPAANQELAKARQSLQSWQGFPNQPPYSIRFIDDLRENRALSDSYQKATETQIRIINSQRESARNQLEAHQRAGRNLGDKAATNQTPEALQEIRDALSLEQIRSRIAAEEIGRLGVRLEAQRIEQEMIQANIQLADLQLQAAEGKSSFTPAELDEILRGIEAERRSAVRKVGSSVQDSTPADPLASWHIEFLDLQKEFWQARFNAHNSEDSAVRKTSLAAFKQWQTHVQDWADIAQIRLDSGAASSAVELDPARLRDALLQARSLQRRIDFAIADLGGSGASIRGKFLESITNSLTSIWQAELYLAEETDILDGKKVITYRAVTVGKILRLAGILIIGWLLLRWISRRILSQINRRPGVTPGAARLIANLTFGIGIALLIIYGFNKVHIPFTAFAFMGGALAIGVGFGAQTILKNLISGIILIFERPFKVGDVVEVDGINGRVESIGLRASRIAHFDGIDTLVPNSYLIENSLTNWSFSSTLMRHDITVGVAYGSDTRQVAHILLAVAEEHGLVLDKPAPEVRFSDFGDNALIFDLFFWLDTNKTQRTPLASDLRYMIEKSLREAAISISFPQRDLHFDPSTPLRVEILRNSPKPTIQT